MGKSKKSVAAPPKIFYTAELKLLRAKIVGGAANDFNILADFADCEKSKHTVKYLRLPVFIISRRKVDLNLTLKPQIRFLMKTIDSA